MIETLKLGRRVIRVGDLVKITGAPGLYKVMGFPTEREVTVHGGKPNRERTRTFTIERIGARPVAANRAARERAAKAADEKQAQTTPRRVAARRTA